MSYVSRFSNPLIFDDRAKHQLDPEQQVSTCQFYWLLKGGFYWLVNVFLIWLKGNIYLPQNIAWRSVASEHFSRKVFCVALSDVELVAPQVNLPCNYSNFRRNCHHQFLSCKETCTFKNSKGVFYPCHKQTRYLQLSPKVSKLCNKFKKKTLCCLIRPVWIRI